MPATPSMLEDHISQVPALQLLQNLGYSYLTPTETLSLRGGKASGVILDGVLEQWLRENNVVHYKGQDYPFTEGNILEAMQTLKDVVYDGLVRTNEKVYDLICLGKSLEQSMSGDIRSFSLKYVDWEHPENNVFHVTEEFFVERTGSKECYTPDIVLFVNGIPFGVIECKRPDLGVGKDPIAQAISQHIRNQKEDGIPHLFTYSQLLMAVSKNDAKYGTTGTPAEFWAIWKEDVDEAVRPLVNKPLAEDKKDKLFATRSDVMREYFDTLEAQGEREVTGQDRAIYSLCRPDRLLELTYRFMVYDAGEKKIARYQQYFCVREIMGRIKAKDGEGKRKGGVVWHTQGSGKSLTMVMLAKAIALDKTITSHRIVLVTDRIDLDDQIWKNFSHCGLKPVQARTGKDLLSKIKNPRTQIITTVIDKFDAALNALDERILDANTFVLVDEGHRGQYGPTHAKMRRVLPYACYIAFTGTPVMRRDKNTIQQFGGLIQPTYTIKTAVEDGAVVRLIYEGRHVPQKVDSGSIDGWFDKITVGLSQDQKADLKRKFSTTDQLNKAEQKVRMIAWDISLHYSMHWQGTPFKAQLVAPNKATALQYKRFLNEFGMVSSEVLISGPDEREGEESIYSENKDEVIRFWRAMMEKYGSEKDYNKQLINSFTKSEQPEIIIVVDKLLTGFDCPRNTILYLTRKLREHTLLQAIARVNRLYKDKQYGYIMDYRGVLEELDQAMDMYGTSAEFEAFDADDLVDTWHNIEAIVAQLPQKHSDLWDLFKPIKNTRDEEQYELLLADDALRARFYERLSDFARTLAVAVSSAKFLEDTPQKKIDQYQNDLKFFRNLRMSVQRRYAEIVDFNKYEPQIQKLLDTYVGTGEIEQITPPVDIFDTERFEEEVAKVVGDAAKADTIAHRTMKTILERMDENPAFYKKFSELLEEAIRAFREERLRAVEYLQRVRDIMNHVVTETDDEIPEPLRNRDSVVKAYYGCTHDVLDKYADNGFNSVIAGVEVSVAIDEIIRSMRIVNWTTNNDIQNQMRNQIEDMLFGLKARLNLGLTFEDIDKIMEECLDIAKVRMP